MAVTWTVYHDALPLEERSGEGCSGPIPVSGGADLVRIPLVLEGEEGLPLLLHAEVPTAGGWLPVEEFEPIAVASPGEHVLELRQVQGDVLRVCWRLEEDARLTFGLGPVQAWR